jgi:predicted ATP-grasp superfamily ATP-dependent carboligase
MKVFVYEHLTAQGIGRDPCSSEHGMFREGRAMRDAILADLRAIPGVAATCFPDESAPVGSELIAGAAAEADWSLVIAPELHDTLAAYTRLIKANGGRLLGPTPRAVELTSDKLALAEHWRSKGVRTPATTDRAPTPCEMFPLVWKPRDGAGSTATYLLHSRFDAASARANLVEQQYTGPMILQEYVPGRAASVAFLCGPAGNVPLLPTFQVLSEDGRF